MSRRGTGGTCDGRRVPNEVPKSHDMLIPIDEAIRLRIEEMRIYKCDTSKGIYMLLQAVAYVACW